MNKRIQSAFKYFIRVQLNALWQVGLILLFSYLIACFFLNDFWGQAYFYQRSFVKTVATLEELLRQLIIYAIPLGLISTQLITTKYSGKLFDIVISKKLDMSIAFSIVTAFCLFVWRTVLKAFIPLEYWIPGAFIGCLALFLSFCFLIFMITKSIFFLNPFTLVSFMESRNKSLLKDIKKLTAKKSAKFRHSTQLVDKAEEILDINNYICCIALKSVKDIDIKLVEHCLKRLHNAWDYYDSKIDDKKFACLFSLYWEKEMQKPKVDRELLRKKHVLGNPDWLGRNVIVQSHQIVENFIHEQIGTLLPFHIFKTWIELNDDNIRDKQSVWLVKETSSKLIDISEVAISSHLEDVSNECGLYLEKLYSREIDIAVKNEMSHYRLNSVIGVARKRLKAAIKLNKLQPVRDIFKLLKFISFENERLSETTNEPSFLLDYWLYFYIFTYGVYSVSNKYFNSMQEVIKQLTVNFDGNSVLGAYKRLSRESESVAESTDILHRISYNSKKFFLAWYCYQIVNDQIAFEAVKLDESNSRHCVIFDLLKTDPESNSLLERSFYFHREYWNRLYVGQFNTCYKIIKALLRK